MESYYLKLKKNNHLKQAQSQKLADHRNKTIICKLCQNCGGTNMRRSNDHKGFKGGFIPDSAIPIASESNRKQQ